MLASVCLPLLCRLPAARPIAASHSLHGPLSPKEEGNHAAALSGAKQIVGRCFLHAFLHRSLPVYPIEDPICSLSTRRGHGAHLLPELEMSHLWTLTSSESALRPPGKECPKRSRVSKNKKKERNKQGAGRRMRCSDLAVLEHPTLIDAGERDRLCFHTV